ncbi:MAG: hypothetical protein LBM25_07990 [Bacteroidales bacterium]|jgi:heme/copper-type cytochrome/quinol oxidase subunit 2|nr:hypothetical protein [Bacteroidales bacterium]
MKKIKNIGTLVILFLAIFIGVTTLSGCSSQKYRAKNGNPSGLRKYSQKKKNTVRQTFRVKDSKRKNNTGRK